MDQSIEEIKRLFAAPMYHPVTTANPGVWRIHDVKFRSTFTDGIKILIRGEHSMWFHAQDCWISDAKDELEMMLQSKIEKDSIKSLCYSKII